MENQHPQCRISTLALVRKSYITLNPVISQLPIQIRLRRPRSQRRQDWLKVIHCLVKNASSGSFQAGLNEKAIYALCPVLPILLTPPSYMEIVDYHNVKEMVEIFPSRKGFINTIES